ncbi:MAG: isoaspartyl peptidase/L-asparaginase, partial [Chitinophagales bacterium]|nr:isoaspartyl peptidase/L-asparaginase [Chitinophagales bacterium]
MSRFAIAVHGGAGTILKSSMTSVLESQYLKGLEDALKSGYEILKKGGSSI